MLYGPPKDVRDDGTVIYYLDHPKRFVQPHLWPFVAQLEHRRKYGHMPVYTSLPLRWIHAERSWDSAVNECKRALQERGKLVSHGSEN